MSKYAKLKDLALAATRGPWVSGGNWVSTLKDGTSVADCSRGDQAYIAAANPTVVLELIEDNDALRQQLADVSNERDELRKQALASDDLLGSTADKQFTAEADLYDLQVKLKASEARNTRADELFRTVLHCDNWFLGMPVSEIESFLAQSAPATDEQGARS